ncbi:MAG: efflux RND transporter periplasmic adaptor subunit [Bacteroidaceae bacterium]|nr:efflux RND transporter periplasmic adaptor subunit [Bacteroidaceae bacterium]
MQNFVFNAFVCVFVILVMSGCHEKKNENGTVKTVRIEYVGESSQNQPLAFPARVVAADKVNMAFKVGGSLKNVFVGEGDRVRKGMLIAELDSRDYEVQLNAVSAEYEEVKASAQRAMTLYADSVVTEADYDKAQYGLERMKAKYENAKNMFDDTRLYAPFDGFVEHKLADVPAVVGAGMPVLTLMSADTPELVINVPASTRNRINSASSFATTFGFNNKSVPLSLISISPNANANQLYKVRLSLPDDMKEKPAVGMSAMVDIVFSSIDKSEKTAVPSSAVFEKDGESAVWVYADGVIVSRKVKIGSLHTNGQVTVLSGLDKGERIVTAGVNRLRENQRVKPLEENSKTNIGGQL